MEDEDVLSPFPLAFDGVSLSHVEPLGAPGQVVDSGKGKYLNQVDVCGRVVKIAEEGGDHFDILPKTKRPEYGQRVADDNKDNEGPEPDEGNDELLPARALHHVNDNFGRVDDQQHEHHHSINAKKGARNVVNTLEPDVVVIDQTRVQQIGKQQHNVHEVNHIRN